MQRICISLLLPAMFTAVCPAEVVFDGSPGYDAPPATLGPWDMTPFADDPTPIYTDVLDVPSPLGGDLLFDIPMSHRRIGYGWGIWGHGYMGDVYYTRGLTEVNLTLPEDTTAFYFYTIPNGGEWMPFEAVTDDGTSSGWVEISWGGAAPYFGFYGLDGDTISTITVTSIVDFAIGEFGIATLNIPAPGMLGLLVLAGLAPARRRR